MYVYKCVHSFIHTHIGPLTRGHNLAGVQEAQKQCQHTLADSAQAGRRIQTGRHREQRSGRRRQERQVRPTFVMYVCTV